MKSPQGHMQGSPKKQHKPGAEKKRRKKESRRSPFKETVLVLENWE